MRISLAKHANHVLQDVETVPTPIPVTFAILDTISMRIKTAWTAMLLAAQIAANQECVLHANPITSFLIAPVANTVVTFAKLVRVQLHARSVSVGNT